LVIYPKLYQDARSAKHKKEVLWLLKLLPRVKSVSLISLLDYFPFQTVPVTLNILATDVCVLFILLQ